MIIKEDINQKIIIYASGKYQIQLLHLIYATINQSTNSYFNYHGEDWLKKFKFIETHFNNKFINSKEQNIKDTMIYIPSLNKTHYGNGTIYIKNELSRYFTLRTKYNNYTLFKDSWLQQIFRNQNVSEYRLITMKEVINLYGKYLFNNSQEQLNNFISKYELLSNCNIYKTVKDIEI